MIKVKPSRFNVVADSQADGSVLLFNTFSTAFCVLNKYSQKFLNRAEYDFNELTEKDRKILEQFLSMGFVVDQDIDELMRIELNQNLVRYGNKQLTLTIGPTLNCNMCCPYCFETKHCQGMTSETAEKLINFIKDYIAKNKIEAVSVVWYGGEPLLELRRIEQISSELIPYCDEKNIIYTASIITNGYFLNKESATLLKSLKVDRAQITIDGMEETHNSRRKLKSGGGSFWPIIKNIEAVKDILSVVIRINVDKKNAQEIDALTDFFMNEMKWGKNPTFYLASVEKCTESCGADLDECLSPAEFSSIYRKTLTKMFEQGITEVSQQCYPAYTAVSCGGLCINHFVIDASGYFYTCWNNFGDISKSIGNLDEPDKIGIHGDYLRWMTVPIPEKCKSCVYLPLCQSGCPDQRLKNQNQPTCSFRHLMYIENVKLAFLNHTLRK